MEPVGHPLPEFDAMRHDTEPPPMGRSRDALSLMTGTDLDNLLKQGLPTHEHGALIGSPGTDLTASRAGGEIRVGFRLTDPFDIALHTYLPGELLPIKGQSSARISLERAAFRGTKVRVEHEATGVTSLEQDDAPAWISAIVYAGKASGLRYLVTAPRTRDFKPPVELLERIGVQVFQL